MANKLDYTLSPYREFRTELSSTCPRSFAPGSSALPYDIAYSPCIFDGPADVGSLHSVVASVVL